MSKHRLLLITTLSILAVQISSLEFFLPVNSFSYGESVVKVKEKMIEIGRVIEKGNYLTASKSKQQSIVMVGDVMLGRNVEILMDREGSDYPYLGLPLRSLVGDAVIVGNFESSMAREHKVTPAGQMKFSVREDFLTSLKGAGFSHMSLANNHSLDYGVSGYQNSVSLLKKSAISPFGHGNILDKNLVTYLNTTKGEIALVGINASQSIPSRADMDEVLSVASKQSELQIVYIHWGNEYELKHNKTQKLLAKELIEAGADLIVGHHPHVVQDIDVIEGVLVFYSLGNYIFDQYFSNEVKTGLVLSIELQSEAVISLVPVISKKNLSQPTLMTSEDHALFLEELADRSHPSLKESIRQGIVPLTDTVATSSKMAIMMP